MRGKAVQHLGEEAVTAVEELTAAVWTFVKDGWSGLWNLVKDKLTTLVDDVVIAAGTWIVEKAILVAGRWIVGLIATMGWSAIIEGLIALWQFAMWIKDQFQRFWQIIESTVDSVHDFVKGNIQPAADKIEGTLQNLIIPAIDLVAKLLNLGNIAKKVEQIIMSVRKMVDDAIEGVIEAVKKRLGFGKKEEKGKKDEEEGELNARHGRITLATLNEPPVTLPRTKEEELQDLDAAQKVLKLAEAKVEDTAALAEYFDPIQKRFRTSSIEYKKIGARMSVNTKINPEKHSYYSLDERDDLKNKVYPHHTKIEDPITQTLGSTTVGGEMIANPIGPDHRTGTAPGNEIDAVMEKLVTDKGHLKKPDDEREPRGNEKYVRGHLLSEKAGGPGKADNLFPITAQANSEMETKIEKWIKKRLDEGYYLYYRVKITDYRLMRDYHIQSRPPPYELCTALTLIAQRCPRGRRGALEQSMLNERRVTIHSNPIV